MSLEFLQRNFGAALGGFLLSTIALVPTSGGAASSMVKDIANYQGADRQTMLEAGAKKGGELQVYITGAQFDPLLKAFVKKYPYVPQTPFRPESKDIPRRIIE